jgi:hypothetical protein
MESVSFDVKPGWRGFLRYCLTWFMVPTALRWGLFLAIGVPLFYAEENWRGRWAWERYKLEQKSKGVALDWPSKLPPSIPDDENFYQAPGMAEWFVKPATGVATTWINPSAALVLPLNRYAKVMVEISRFQANGEPDPINADAVLEYDPPVVRWRRAPGGQTGPTSAPATNGIPLIVMDQVPLMDAIRNLARQAGVNYMVDPTIVFGSAGPNGRPLPQPSVSIRFENVTAMYALRAVLKNYNLLWVPDLPSRIARIVRCDPNQPPVVLDQGVRRRLEKLVRDSLGQFLYGPQGIILSARPFNDARPLRLAIRTEAPLGAGDLAFLTSQRGFGSEEAPLSGLTIQSAPEKWFFAVVPPSSACTADDYLAWSDGFEADFDQMREALKRPYALPPGSYRDPAGMPVENFVAMRTVCQTLAQRAQCQLLLGRPGKALKELTLLHNLCRILDGPPTNRPTTLATAMIDVALAGLYASVVEDGLRLQAWQEPQLAALQAQLEEVNLCPILIRAFADEPALSCSTLERAGIAHLSPSPAFGSPPPRWFQKLKDPQYLLLKLAPRGWVYHNLVNLAELFRRLNDVLDDSGRFFVPHRVDQANNDIQVALTHFSLRTALASLAIPNSVRACQIMVFNQTRINQLALACAIERFHLARSRYPDSLEALAPEFVRVIPLDIINGRPLHYSRIPDQGYQLYSVGWDEKDDGGVPAPNAGWGKDIARLDWVWRFPAK